MLWIVQPLPICVGAPKVPLPLPRRRKSAPALSWTRTSDTVSASQVPAVSALAYEFQPLASGTVVGFQPPDPLPE